MPTIELSAAGGSGSVEFVVADFTPFVYTPSGASGYIVLDLSDIPDGSLMIASNVAVTYSFSIGGNASVQSVSGHMIASVLSGTWESPGVESSNPPFPASESGSLVNGAINPQPIIKTPETEWAVDWRFQMQMWNAFDDTPPSSANWSISTLSITIYYDSTESFEGTPVPHIETSEAQALPPPIPGQIVISATVEDDVEDTYAGAMYLWTLIGSPTGSAVQITSPGSLTTQVWFTAYVPGVYTFRMMATAGSNSISGTTQVTIPVSQAPRVRAETRVTTYPTPVTVDPVVTDDFWNGPLTYAWTQVGGPAATIVSPSTRSTEFQFPEMQGTYSFRLTASNNLLSGTGIIKVLNYANIGPEIIVGRQLYVTIGDVEYVTGVAEG